MPPEDTLESSAAEVAADIASKSAASTVVEPSPKVETPSEEVIETPSPSKEFIEKFKTSTGIDLSEKYADDDAATKGLSEAFRMVGQRSTEAENWKRFAEAAAGHEDEIKLILEGKRPATSQPESAPKGEEPWTPKSFDELRLLATKIFDENGAVRSNVDQRLVNRYADANQKLQETAFELAFAPDKVREKLMGTVKQELLAETAKISEAKMTEQQLAVEMQNITDKHAEKLFVDGNREQYTPFGQQVLDEWNELLETGAQPAPKTYRKAIKTILDKQPKPNPTKPTNPNAVHKPALAPAITNEVEFSENYGLVDLFRDIQSGKRKDLTR